MNQGDLVQKVCDRFPMVSRKYVAGIVGAVFQEIMLSLINGEDVKIQGLGTFARNIKPSRKGHNPRTGQPIEIPQHYAPSLRFGKAFRTKVASQDDQDEQDERKRA